MKIARFLFGLSVAAGIASPAAGAPPASCAKKFIGTWQHTGAFGVTNIATLTANGVAACSGNPFCVQGTWTCDGNSLSYNNTISVTVYTLSPDGKHMTAPGGNNVVRLDAAPVGAAAPAPARTFRADDITGETPRDRADAIKLANQYLTQARAAGRYCTEADQKLASDNYFTAARFFAQAGDSASEARASRAAEEALQRASRCDRQRTAAAERAGRRENPTTNALPRTADPQFCSSQATTIAALGKSGIASDLQEARAMRVAAVGQGCQVQLLPGETSMPKPNLRDCIRAKLLLGNAQDVRDLLKAGGCK
jgi:hypothetical protein